MTQKEKYASRSGCPINFAVEMLGDKWSLLIVRDIIFYGKKTYGEFLKSDERIATNILSSKLVLLESNDILSKSAHSTDKRKDVYELTEKGQGLIPVILEIFSWGAIYNPSKTKESNTFEEILGRKLIEQFQEDKQKTIEQIKEIVKRGGFVFSNEQI